MAGERYLVLLGKQIRLLRKKQGLTQAAVSKRAVTISEKRWSDIERGMYAIGLTTLVNIAKSLKVPLQELFKYEEAGPEKQKNNFLKKNILTLEKQATEMDDRLRIFKKTVKDLKKSLEP